ncbi:MAG: glycosyltransferase family 4 protein [Tatlockia sp.]|nr:glycosyltransferase family 4 protein [Tatlockia sp.]
MKVLIVNNMTPFVWGGAEELATHLQKNLIIAGYEAEVLRIPFQWEPATRIPSQMLMARAFELDNVDRVIALKFPAYLIRHPHKTFWLLHQYRQAYDLFDAGQTNIPFDETGERLRALIKAADNESFAESKKIFTNSEVTRKRLLHYNGFNAQVLHPPVNDPELFSNAKDGDYIFAGGRINSMKRQHLLLEAMSKTNSQVKLLIAGPPDSESDANQLIEMVERFGLKDRVKLDMCFLPRATYANYVNNSLAVAYLPYDEDSLGYVAMEAALAAKPLLSTRDSGGILGLAINEETGWVAEANPASLAEAMNAVWKNPACTKNFGAALKEHWLSLGVNWPQTVETLLQ